MINVCAIFLVLASFSVFPADSSLLPIQDGLPALFSVIEGKNSKNTELKGTVDMVIHYYGMDMLNRYCIFTEQQSTVQCKKVNLLFVNLFKDNLLFSPAETSDWMFPRSNSFPKDVLNGYLNRIAHYVQNKKTVTMDLRKAIIDMGWKEMKDACETLNKKELGKDLKETCKFVNRMNVEPSDWNSHNSG